MSLLRDVASLGDNQAVKDAGCTRHVPDRCATVLVDNLLQVNEHCDVAGVFVGDAAI